MVILDDSGNGRVVMGSIGLVLLTLQTSMLILLMQHTLRTEHYIAASVVVSVEFVKLIASFVIEMMTLPRGKRNPIHVFRSIKYDLIYYRSHVIRLAIPAALYAIQNNLSHFALARINAVSFQVIQQLKILTTAIFAVLLLGKHLTWRHWISLSLLTSGVIIVQLSNLQAVSKVGPLTAKLDIWLGFLGMIITSLSSGFAGIYFEKSVKSFTPKPPETIVAGHSSMLMDKVGFSAPRSIWIQSLELGLFGLLFSLILALTGDNLHQISSKGFFAGYGYGTISVVLVQALGGLLVAMVVQYGDSILKAFATSASIVLSAFIVFVVWRQSFTWSLLVGTTMVGISLYMYAMADNLQTNRILTSKRHRL